MKKLLAYFKSPSVVSKLLIVLAGILFFVLLQNITPIWNGIVAIFAMISPALWGCLIAYLLNPIAKFIENKILGKMKKRKAAHGIATAIAFILALALLTLLIVAIVPQLTSSVITLFDNVEGYFQGLKTFLNDLNSKVSFIDINVDELIGTWSGLFTTITQWVIDNADGIIGASFKVGSGVFNFFLALFFAIYILLDKENLKRLYRRFRSSSFKQSGILRADSIIQRSNKILIGYLGGNITDSLIVGLANFVVMTIFGWPYPLLISVIVAVTNIIPTFGPIIGAVPCLLIILLVEPLDALWFLILTVVLQTIDGNVIKPLLFGDSTGLRPLWVLLSIVVGGKIAGITGMLLGVPVFAILSFIIQEHTDAKLAARGFDTDGNAVTAENGSDKPEKVEESPKNPPSEPAKP